MTSSDTNRQLLTRLEVGKNLIEHKQDVTQQKVSVRCVQRNKNKYNTIIENLPLSLEEARAACKYFRTLFSCSGSVKVTDNNCIVIQLTGNHVTRVVQWVEDTLHVDPRNIQVQGQAAAWAA